MGFLRILGLKKGNWRTVIMTPHYEQALEELDHLEKPFAEDFMLFHENGMFSLIVDFPKPLKVKKKVKDYNPPPLKSFKSQPHSLIEEEANKAISKL